MGILGLYGNRNFEGDPFSDKSFRNVFCFAFWNCYLGCFYLFYVEVCDGIKDENYQIVIVLVSCFTCVFWLSFAWVYGIYIKKKKEFWKER